MHLSTPSTLLGLGVQGTQITSVASGLQMSFLHALFQSRAAQADMYAVHTGELKGDGHMTVQRSRSKWSIERWRGPLAPNNPCTCESTGLDEVKTLQVGCWHPTLSLLVRRSICVEALAYFSPYFIVLHSVVPCLTSLVGSYVSAGSSLTLRR